MAGATWYVDGTMRQVLESEGPPDAAESHRSTVCAAAVRGRFAQWWLRSAAAGTCRGAARGQGIKNALARGSGKRFPAPRCVRHSSQTAAGRNQLRERSWCRGDGTAAKSLQDDRQECLVGGRIRGRTLLHRQLEQLSGGSGVGISHRCAAIAGTARGRRQREPGVRFIGNGLCAE